jgi:hypothetical protein
MTTKIKTFKEASELAAALNSFLDEKHSIIVPIVSNDTAEKLLKYMSYSAFAFSQIADKEGNCGDFTDTCVGTVDHAKLDPKCKDCKIRQEWE